MVEDITPVSIEITYKTPEYCRILNKKYREKNKEKERVRKLQYRKKKLQEGDENYILAIKKNNQRQYLKRKEKGITPEEKAKKAAYMKEYRARKKLEKQNTQIV